MEGENALNGFKGHFLWRQFVTIAVCGLSSLGRTRLCSHFHRLRRDNKTDGEWMTPQRRLLRGTNKSRLLILDFLQAKVNIKSSSQH